MKNIYYVLVLLFGLNQLKAHDFVDTSAGTVVASFDVSGSEIWHNYFMFKHRLLVVPIDPVRGTYNFVNHPEYKANDLPVHRSVCLLERGFNGDVKDRCNDEFPHVHVDDFKLAMKFAEDTCASLGSQVVPEFEQPTTFVSVDKLPASSHHYHYKLFQGLKFDCIAL